MEMALVVAVGIGSGFIGYLVGSRYQKYLKRLKVEAQYKEFIVAARWETTFAMMDGVLAGRITR